MTSMLAREELAEVPEEAATTEVAVVAEGVQADLKEEPTEAVLDSSSSELTRTLSLHSLERDP